MARNEIEWVEILWNSPFLLKKNSLRKLGDWKIKWGNCLLFSWIFFICEQFALSMPAQLDFYKVVIYYAYSVNRNTIYCIIILYPYCHNEFLKIFKLNTVEPWYGGHSNVGDIFFKSGWNHSQILIMKPVYSGQFLTPLLSAFSKQGSKSGSLFTEIRDLHLTFLPIDLMGSKFKEFLAPWP